MPLQLLTKGDVSLIWKCTYGKVIANMPRQNNAADDTELYAKGQSFLDRKEDVIGSVVGYVPMVGSRYLHPDSCNC